MSTWPVCETYCDPWMEEVRSRPFCSRLRSPPPLYQTILCLFCIIHLLRAEDQLSWTPIPPYLRTCFLHVQLSWRQFNPQAAGLVAFPWISANLGSGNCKGNRASQCLPTGKGAMGTWGPICYWRRNVVGATAVSVAPRDCAPAGPTGRRGGEEERRGAGHVGRDGGGAVAPAGGSGWARREVPLRELQAPGVRRARYNPESEVQCARARAGERGIPESPPGTSFPATIQPRVAGGAGGGPPMEFT